MRRATTKFRPIQIARAQASGVLARLQRIWPRRRSHRIVALSLFALIVVGVVYYPLSQYLAAKRYVLNAQAQQLLGGANRSLAAKFSYQANKHEYVFNKAGMDAAAAKESSSGLSAGNASKPDPIAAINQAKAQIGGSSAKDDSLYSVELPTDPTKGLTYNDNNLNLSFSITPLEAQVSGKRVGDRIVYPLSGAAQAVYTAKTNGLKEDIILNKPIGDEVTFSYRLKLPAELEARINDDGSLGVYSADPALFGNISYGSSDDQFRVMSARKDGKKDHLVFVLPAPTIKQTGASDAAAARAYYSYDGNTLKVEASGLAGLKYPVSVDPSVVVTSSSDFGMGNNEDNSINYATAGQISRAGMTGGSVSGGWASTASLSTARKQAGSVVYNGYMYITGGYNSTTGGLSDVQYAQIKSDGTLGAWTPTTSLPGVRSGHAATAYNGYLYVLGGGNTSGDTSDVLYAPVNPTNGTLGAWTTTTSFTAARSEPAAAVYNGYIYILGGTNIFDGYFSSVQFAPVNANGSVGAWTTTSSFAQSRASLGAVAYNGYVYILGGTNGTSYFNDVQYAQITANGSIVSWTTTSSFTTARSDLGATVYGGYLYIMGGTSGTNYSDVQYAQINANGSIGSWIATASFTTARNSLSAVSYDGYLYMAGGYDGTNYYGDVQYAKIDPAGVTGVYATTTALLSETNKGKTYNSRADAGTVVYNGYIYELGGYTGSPAAYYYSSVIYAPVNADGTIGAWTTTTALSTGRAYLAATAYNGYMYIIGGTDGTTTYGDVQYAPINSTGTLGAWTATSSIINAREALGATVYNGYMYVLAGDSGGSMPTYYNDVQYAPINSTGTLGAWHYTHNGTDDGTTFVAGFATVRRGAGVVVNGGYVYVINGRNSGSSLHDVQFAPLNANGTVGTWLYTYDSTSSSTPNGTSYYGDGGDGTGYQAYNGNLYIIGINDAGSSGANGVAFAPFNADGTLGTIVDTTAFTNHRLFAGTAIVGGYLYLLGGVATSTYYSDVQFARINNSGTGAAGTWTATTSLTDQLSGQASVAYNGYMYVLAGHDASMAVGSAGVLYAPINSNGTLGSWSSTTSMSYVRYYFSAVVYNGYLYAIGGYGNSAPQGTYSVLSNVESAPISSDGTVGAWTLTSSLITPREHHTSVAYNGYVYLFGGDSGGTYYNDVQYAPITSGGTLGAWHYTHNGIDDGTTFVAGFATPRSSHMSVLYNGYVYVFGGQNSSTKFGDVQFARLNSNGTVGAWTASTSMMGLISAGLGVASNGYLYAIGGVTGSGVTNTVQYAPITASGALGPWTYTSSFTTPRYSLSGAIANGFLYLIGGSNSPNYYADAQYAPLNVIARTARYSKLVDLGTTTNIADIKYTGTLPNGKASITYKTAGTDGIFGATQQGYTLPGVCTAGGTTRYALITVQMDDRGAGTMPDLSPATLQDITVYYSTMTAAGVQPSQRLMGGKTVQQSTGQTGLDTLKLTTGGSPVCT